MGGRPYLKESVIYQDIFAEGVAFGRAEVKVEIAQQLILRLGTKRFGEPNLDVVKRIHTISDLERLDQMTFAILDIADWEDLLAVN